MDKELINNLKRFKYLYLHPHGMGDLIMSMPYIRNIMNKNNDFALIVREPLYNSGFFISYPFKERVFPLCPGIWNKNQTIKNFKNINRFCRDLKSFGIEAFYLKFNKCQNRSQQIQEGLSRQTKINTSFNPDILGEVYLNSNDLDNAKEEALNKKVFLHARSASVLKSVAPERFLENIDVDKEEIFSPHESGNINRNFAMQYLCKKNVIIDSVYMHSAAALKKDIDLLFVSVSVKSFFHTLVPANIKINKIIYGNFKDLFKAYVYYKFKKTDSL